MTKSIYQLEQELALAKKRIVELELFSGESGSHSPILQNMFEGVCLVSVSDASIIYANSVFEKMFGYESGELINQHISIVNAPDCDPEKSASEIMAALIKNGAWQGEVKNIKKDGTVFWCYAKVISYNDSKYGPVYIAVHQNINDRKFIESQLNNQKTFETSLIETAKVIILVLDASGNILNINPYLEQLSGYEKSEVLGKDWFTTFLPERDQDVIRDLFNQAIKGTKTSGNINPILSKDGHEICIEWYDSTLKNANGEIIGLLAIGQDISEKRKTEHELHKMHRTLSEIQTAMDLVGIGIHIADIDGRFLYVNNAACKMLGYTKDEMLSMAIPDIDHNFPKGAFDELTKDLRDKPGTLETTQLTKDGKIIPVEVTFQFFPDNEKGDGHFVAFLVDLTDRKKAESEHELLQKQLLQSQKMESIGHLTGGVAHDFNNMLAAILGYAALLNKQLAALQLEDNKTREYLDHVMTAANRARELISQMLVFSRHSSNEDPIDIQVIDIKPVLQEVKGLLYSSFPSTIEISMQYTNDNLMAQITPVQLHQILLNLCINARDAIDEYGQIRIRIYKEKFSTVCMSCHKNFDGDYIVLEVSDSGKGISEDELQRIFEPFYTTKEIGKGSGMGLSVIHGIVHGIEGHILVSSQINNKTTFKILLPLKSAEQSPQQTDKRDLVDDVQLQGLNIMIVDDEAQIASMMAEIFEMHGAQTVIFDQSVEALEIFKTNPDAIDIVLTDETMPNLSGLDLSKAMLKIRPQLPVIISTGFSEHVNQKIANEHGVAGFMLKPVDIEKLIEMVVDLTDIS